jgi:[acyl-carrier-protein] S-malonyltransferase
MLLIAAPGQGAQAPGFLREWLELPHFAERLGLWSELASCDLIRYGTTADADEIRDTAIAQPLLVAAAIATAAELAAGSGRAVPPGEHSGPRAGGSGGVVPPGQHSQSPRLADAADAAGVGAAAGHSVGELAAGAIAGALAPDDAIRLVRVRGQAMARAAAAEATGMTAVLGGDEPEVLAAIEASGLTPANVNGAGQIVAAGTVERLAAFAADPPPRARLRPLSVAGAFHTRHMGPAVDALRDAAATVAVHSPVLVLLSNRDGSVVHSGPDWLERIVTQVSTPVRWDLCMQTMTGLGVTALIELPPAGTLTGLARRALPGVQTLALKSPGDLDAARELLAAHGTAATNGGAAAAGDGAAARQAAAARADARQDTHPDSHAPDWRLLVAPLAGTFRAGPGPGLAAEPGAEISTGAELGHVEMRGGSQPVSSAFPATIIEWLVEDGDPVTVGQPLVRLQPNGTE